MPDPRTVQFRDGLWPRLQSIATERRSPFGTPAPVPVSTLVNEAVEIFLALENGGLMDDFAQFLKSRKDP